MGTWPIPLGIVIRYSQGQFIAGNAKRVGNVFSTPHIEISVAREEVAFVTEMGFTQVSFESGSL